MLPKSSEERFIRIQHRGIVAPMVVFGIVAVALVGAGIYYFISGRKTTTKIQPILAEVTVGDFVSQVLDQGEIQSSENVEIRCEVRARNGSVGVIEVVPEGTRVKAGDFLVQLDSSSFDVEMESQKIALANAETSVIQSKAAVEVAKESKIEYEQGVFLENKRMIQNEIFDAESQIETAKQELSQARAAYGHSQKLAQKGLITKNQLEADFFAVTKSELALERAENSKILAETKMKALTEFTYKKDMIQFESDIEAAKVKYLNDQESLDIEKNKLKEIQDNIDKCRIVVPPGVEGQVVYAKESSRGGNDWVLEEGTTVRERQVLVRLPNPDKMEVKALINEQSITQIDVGMPATIKVDALSNLTLKGIVTKVNQYAESSGWMSSSVRKYAVLVRILDPPETLKPGMNAAVTIQVRYDQDVLMAPIQTVYAVGDRQFCLVKKGEQEWGTREIEVVADNSQMVQIASGLSEGEELVMNPGAYKELMDLPEMEMETRIDIPDSAKQAVADASKKGPGGPGNRAGNDGPTERGGPGREDGRGERGGPGGRRGEGGGRRGEGGGRRGGGMGGFSMPASGAALVQEKDQDGDGKLTKDEAGSPYNMFFDRVDTDSDGLLSAEELDSTIQRMRERMQGQGGGGGFGGGGNP